MLMNSQVKLVGQKYSVRSYQDNKHYHFLMLIYAIIYRGQVRHGPGRNDMRHYY